MENMLFSSGEVREMLDLSRSALRYYIRKGLLDVEKCDENGYHTFSQNNLNDLRDISYLRQVLDFGINEIQDCLNASTPADYQKIFAQKRSDLELEISQKTKLLKRLQSWEDYLKDLKDSPNRVRIVHFSTPFVFAPTVSPSIDKLPLLCSSFNFHEGKPVFGGYGYCFDEPDQIDQADFPKYVYRFPSGEYIYAMLNSEYAMDDPRLLTPALEWARNHNFDVRDPIQVDYFFRIKTQDGFRYFYAVTIPFADCDIQVDRIRK